QISWRATVKSGVHQMGQPSKGRRAPRPDTPWSRTLEDCGLPCDKLAEQRLFSCILNDSTLIDRLIDLPAADLYFPSHRVIREAFIRVAEHGIGIDALAVADELKRMRQLEEVGGFSYVLSLDSPIAASTIGSQI